MSNQQTKTTENGKFSNDDFYLPAVALPPNFDRIESVVSDLFDFHGVVLIPDSYNK
ncbi:hypothetical protein SAMN05443574_1202 [Haloarcula vallismortis]|uniref:Uncharacterized protein n=2 Tax=Haloarcula vallismortis TaxID=28442 RepID=M0JIH2_HALVA|nr:hypothetical protein [Haloarcula vallismortis]EMA08801.1 hypothetical protein C437_07587 [Haloarcula vallismortis ATCC 29715]SDX22499.1 hypothetical protein SAMN05443574_1202 [Haloarcula vallismortis]